MGCIPSRAAWLQVALTALAPGDSGADQAAPPSLVRMSESVSSTRTGRVEYIIEETISSQSAAPVNRKTVQWRKWITQFTGTEILETNLGNEHGAVRPTEDGMPHPGLSQAPRHLLQDESGTWIHQELDLQAENRDIQMSLDPRTFGVLYGVSRRTCDETIWRDPVSQPSPRKYRERMEGDLHVVSADSDVGEITWWIDAEKDWLPVRVTLTVDGQIQSECRSRLAKFDGHWFPEVVQYFRIGHERGFSPHTTVSIRSAEFNRADHPTRITPEDIGIVPYYTTVIKTDRMGEETGAGFFNGTSFVTHDVAAKERRENLRQESMDVADGATPLSLEPASQPTAGKRVDLRYFETEWQEYTREFIERFRLDADQSQKAWLVCRECEQAASAHIEARRQTFDEIDKILARFEASGIDKPDRTVIQALAERQRLLEPLRRTFHLQLVPRLERIPTRAQRAATQPAGAAQKPE